MTIDTRQVNERTEVMPWPMPVLVVVIGELEGATYSSRLIGFGFAGTGSYHCILIPKNCTLSSLIVEIILRPKCPWVLAYCQWVVEEIFGGILGVCMLAWLDDILGFAESEDALLDVLDKLIWIEIHAKKCKFFVRDVKWCGRMTSGERVKHCPERVQGLVEMRHPVTAAELQQFLCTVNWVRQSIPEFTRITSKLYDVLDRAIKTVDSHKNAQLSKVLLADVGCGTEETSRLETFRVALLAMAPLPHPIPESKLCLYTL
ncbi:Retroelement [Phytophthora megakarya]|uniref:Retroelement n=1 Tax=Phytophthora megakarya TaxID=4795 RepID=A0A225W6Y3_9STRA|nr:Retroelement [Phytophthora megakarya]